MSTQIPDRSLKPKPDKQKTAPRKNKWIPKNPRERARAFLTIALAVIVLFLFLASIGGLTTTWTLVHNWFAPQPTLMATTEIVTQTPESTYTPTIAVTESITSATMEPVIPSPSPSPTLTATKIPTLEQTDQAAQQVNPTDWKHDLPTASFQLDGVCYTDEKAENWIIWINVVEGTYAEGCEPGQQITKIVGLTVLPRNMAVRPRAELPSVKLEQRDPWESSNFDRWLDPDYHKRGEFVTVCAVNAESKIDGYYIKSRHIIVLNDTEGEDDPSIQFTEEQYKFADLDVCYFVKEKYVSQTVQYFIGNTYVWMQNSLGSAGYFVRLPVGYSGLWFADLPQELLPEDITLP